MGDVFISYSRRDKEFVSRLTGALERAGRQIWIDWEDIARGEDWWNEIQRGIEGADSVLFVITENWLVSEICHKELLHARKQHKRIFPIIRQQIKDDVEKRVKGTWMDSAWEQMARENWKELREINWLFFDDEARFETELGVLLQSLDADIPHIKAHTRYHLRALEWESSARNPSYLLTGDDLQFAEGWLKEAAAKTPIPTEIQGAYITMSRVILEKQSQRIQRLRRSAWVAGAVGAVAIAAVAIAVPFSLNAVNISRTAQAAANTATVEQGVARAEAQSARTQAAEAAATLAPVPATLTAVGEAVLHAQAEQDIARLQATAMDALNDGFNADAERIAQLLLDSYPDYAATYGARGQILERLSQLNPDGSLVEAVTAEYSRAIELEPQNPNWLNARGGFAVQQGQFEAAIADFDAAITLNPDDPIFYYNRGDAQVAGGDLTAAIADFNRTLEITPDDAYALNSRGYAHYLLGDYQAAIADFDRALLLDATYAKAYLNRGDARYQLGETEAALADFSLAVETNPFDPLIYQRRGEVYLELERFAEAEVDYSAAIQNGAWLPEAWLGRSRARAALGDLPGALTDFDEFVALGGEVTAALRAYRETLLGGE
jgi:tetratricopeptide (TPR) repeat protein